MVGLKKLYDKTKALIEKHQKLSFFIPISLIVIIGLIAEQFDLTIFSVFVFAFSILTLIRLITYTKGYVVSFMDALTWYRYKRKYQEKAEMKHKEMSIRRATIYFMSSIVSFFVWIISEIVMLFVK